MTTTIYKLKQSLILLFMVLFCICITTEYTYSKVIIDTDIENPLTFIATRIKMFEGFSAYRYRDSVHKDVWLQGYGRSIRGRTPTKISKNTAHKWLYNDLITCKIHLDKHMPWWNNLSKVRQCAMLDLTYNLGIEKLKKFKKFLYHMERGNYTTAAHHLVGHKKRKTPYARQVGVRSREVSHAIVHNEWKYMKK